ncbi:MAG: hypothetical protein ACI9JD_004875, partial [Rhodococcus sp. (in: high G+C Gram-positive bacteria)]
TNDRIRTSPGRSESGHEQPCEEHDVILTISGLNRGLASQN